MINRNEIRVRFAIGSGESKRKDFSRHDLEAKTERRNRAKKVRRDLMRNSFVTVKIRCYPCFLSSDFLPFIFSIKFHFRRSIVKQVLSTASEV
jgi:hypothetical protein